MRALLIQHRCKAALEVLPADMEAQTKAELTKKAHSAVILCLGNKVLREVTRETTAAGEIKERSKAKGDDGEGLYVRGRTDRKDSHQSRGKSRSKSRGYAKKDEQPSSSGSTYDNSEDVSYNDTCLDILFDFLECDGGSVQLGDNREYKIRGIGKVRIKLKDGSSFMLHNVRYIPKLKRNLISLGTLEKEGFTVKLQSGKIKVINGSRVVLSGIRRDNCVYSLDGHALAGELNASVEEKDSLAQVWHKRLRHISEAGLHVLEKFNTKHLEKFKEWNRVLVENQTGRTVKKLRTDNGLECCNREFEQLCIKSGIARHLIVSGMPSPLTVIEKKTPMEMWSGNPSDYGMLRIFSCVAYPHNKQGKLEPRAIKYVHLGYPEGVKGYRLYRLDGESPKIVTSRSVVFNESVMYKDTLKDSGAGDKSVEELQVKVELQRLNNHTPEEDKKDQEDGDD
ncbi:retrotransposon protein, putative, ty1-copia subclass [Tanacetum coccineum]